MAIEILGKPTGDVEVERCAPGRPHEGKVLAAVQAHADDIPLFSAGAIAKLVDEAYATGRRAGHGGDQDGGTQGRPPLPYSGKPPR